MMAVKVTQVIITVHAYRLTSGFHESCLSFKLTSTFLTFLTNCDKSLNNIELQQSR